MSRYKMEPNNDRHTVIVGWDRMLSNFYLQVLDEQAESDLDYEVLMMGSDGYAIEIDAAEVLSRAKEYASIPDDLLSKLLKDEERERPEWSAGLEHVIENQKVPPKRPVPDKPIRHDRGRDIDELER